MSSLLFFFSIYLQEESDEEESYLKRLDSGLFILQGVDYILVEACAGCPPTVKQRVTRILSQRRASLKTIRHIMRGNSHYFDCNSLLLKGKLHWSTIKIEVLFNAEHESALHLLPLGVV